MEKEYKIVETLEYTLAISDEEIRNEDLCYDSLRKCITKKTDKITCNGEIYKKIIAHLPKGNAKELDLPLLPQMIVEDDVEKLTKQLAKENGFVWEDTETSARRTFEMWAKDKLTTKIFNEEDLRKAFKHGIVFKEESVSTCKEAIDAEFDVLIKLIKQPKTPNAFVAKMEEVCKPMPNIHVKTWELKTTINSKRQKVLVGKYKYD